MAILWPYSVFVHVLCVREGLYDKHQLYQMTNEATWKCCSHSRLHFTRGRSINTIHTVMKASCCTEVDPAAQSSTGKYVLEHTTMLSVTQQVQANVTAANHFGVISNERLLADVCNFMNSYNMNCWWLYMLLAPRCCNFGLCLSFSLINTGCRINVNRLIKGENPTMGAACVS